MYRKYIKRLFDILLSLIGLPFLIFISIVIAPIIFISDNGPVFYNALRLGKDGKIFKMYKFRSMKKNAPDIRNKDGTTYNSDSDPRVTRIGHFMRQTSLDELPQLVNVLRGDMSIIGPRPDLPDALEVYRNNEASILSVRPGITGYSQSFYRNSIELHKRFEQDLYYIDNISFLFDIRILLRTIPTVLLRKSIYRDASIHLQKGTVPEEKEGVLK